MKKAIVKITPDKLEAKRNLWYEYQQHWHNPRHLCELKVVNGIPLLQNHSVGIRLSPYCSINGNGSLSGMKKNFDWANDTVFKPIILFSTLTISESAHG